MRASIIAGLLVFSATAPCAAPAPVGQIERVVVQARPWPAIFPVTRREREVLVYTPPGYATDTKQRYPVIYFLHGYGVTAQFYANTMNWPTAIDRAINEAHAAEDDRGDAGRVHTLRRLDVFQLRDHGQLGGLRGARPRQLHRLRTFAPLPSARRAGCRGTPWAATARCASA